MSKGMRGLAAAVPAAVERAARRLVAAAVAAPRAVLVAWAVVTLLPLGGLARLARDTDGRAMVPRGAAALAIDDEVRARFGLRDALIVWFDTGRPDGVFEPALLADVERVTALAAELPGVGREHVMSLATEARDRLYPGSSETYGHFLKPLPTTPAQLAELRQDLDAPAARLLTGTVVAPDRSGTAVQVGVARGDRREGVDREALVRALEKIVEPLRRPGLAIDVVGAPAAESLLASHVLRDMALLVPLSMLVIALVIWRGTGRAAPVALALVKVGATIVWTFGVLGLLGVPVYLTVAIVPVVLAAMGIADEIHVMTRFPRALAESADARQAVLATFDELAMPVAAATLTTSIGFLACLASPVAPVRALGAAAAIGILYSLAFTLTVTPALLASLPARWFAVPPRPGRGRLGAALAAFAVARRKATLGALAVLTLAAVAGASRLVVQDGWIDNFARGSAFRRATDRVNARLLGVHRLDLHLAFPQPGDLARPEVVAALERFERAVAARPDVGGVVGPVRQMRAVADFWRLPEPFRDTAEILRTVDRFDFSPGPARRRRVLAEGLAETVVPVFLKEANYRDVARLEAALARLHREHLAPFGATLRFAGDVAVSQEMIPAVVASQLASLPLALLGVLAAVAALCGSVRLALWAVLPAAVSGLWLLGLLGAAGVPLGVATSMFFVIALGLGVDSHSIHLIARYRQLRREGITGAAARAAREVSAAVVVNTVAVAAGFGLLALSAVPANRRLGLLVAGGLVLGAAITLSGLVALLALDEPDASLRTETEAPAARAALPMHNRSPIEGETV